MLINCNDPLAQAADLFCDQEMDIETIETSIASVLKAIGEDPEREGLQRTPHRVAKSYQELLSGYRVDPKALINDAIFSVSYDQIGS